MLGLSQLLQDAFEVVVVCEQNAAQTLRHGPFSDCTKIVAFDEPNISRARNLGLARAAGDIVAFIDDDAVPEPTWLTTLTAPIVQNRADATGGFVRGRNGISFQWKASTVDQAGRSYMAQPQQDVPESHVWRTEGTNMAFRRSLLVDAGGFDERFHFFLEETDLNRRLAARTVIVPEAQVHHGFLASVRRRSDRVPTDLQEIGASTALFLAKHAPAEMQTRLDEVRREQRARLLRHMVAGRLEPRDIRTILQSLEDGILQASTRQESQPHFPQPPAFLAFRRAQPNTARIFAGHRAQKALLLAQAKKALDDGTRPTVILFSRDIRYMQVKYVAPGVWLHEGGQFGKAERHEPFFQFCSLDERIERETARIGPLRGIG